jgi:hypothetical protein
MIHRRRTTAVHFRKPLELRNVYFDEFLGLVQGNKWQRRQIIRALIHAFDSVFHPLDDDDSCHRQELASLQKTGKGGASWVMTKNILGWMLNIIDKTMSLLSHRLMCLKELLSYFTSSQKRKHVLKWQQLLGELRSMVSVVSAVIGLFSALHKALTHNTKCVHRVHLTRHVHAFLEDFRWLARDILTRPTNITEIIPDVLPSTRGTCYASKQVMDGIQFVPIKHGKLLPLPLVPRAPKRYRILWFHMTIGQVMPRTVNCKWRHTPPNTMH